MQTTTAKSGSQTASLRKSSSSSGPKSQGKKKKTQQSKSNGISKETPGPRHVAPPPVSGPWGNPNPLTNSAAPPPGFAASAPKPPSVGFSDAHVRLLRHRMLFAFRFLVGKAVELQLIASEERYAGILDCVDPDDFSIVLKNAKRLSSGTNAKPFVDGSTVIFGRQKLAYLVADGAINYTDGVFTSGASAVSSGFRTDTEISGEKGEHLFGRELETASSWLDPALDTGALEDSTPTGRRHSKNQSKAGWNQFEANEKLFGVVSTYDENIYTTKLDKSKITTEQSRAAEQLALEIEHESAAGNFHLQEERGQTAKEGKDANELDEEARYSSVDRRGSANKNVYMPPALRNAQRQSSGDNSKAPLNKAPTGVTTSARPAVKPAPAVTEAPVATVSMPKPLSFSEAVTGRSNATATPAVVAQAAPTSGSEGRKSAVKSPQKATASTQIDNKTAKAAAVANSREVSPVKKDPARGKALKTEPKAESKSESQPLSSSSSITSTTSTSTGTTKLVKDEMQAGPKKGLNPNAKEFKLNATAPEFTPSFSAVPAVKDNLSSPFRGGSPSHISYPHPGMGYPPMMLEDWMYDSAMGGDEEVDVGMAPYIQSGYAMPMGPGGVPMMYPFVMPQQNMRMMGGQRGNYGSYPQQGYNPRGYYSPPNGNFGVPYTGGPAMPGCVGPQPPLPPTPSGDESTNHFGATVPPVPVTPPEVEFAGGKQPPASK